MAGEYHLGSCLHQHLTDRLGFVAKKLCPELILVPIRFERYSEISKKVMAIFQDYDPNMLAASCDEGYLKYVKPFDNCGVPDVL
jgi:nucleotidyltransferase/DNA polymerase involved in DNA repair